MQQGFWPVMDQGLFAVSNFILNLLMARWLVPGDFGMFGVAYAGFLLIGALHTAIVSEPMLVYGPNKYERNNQGYLRKVLRLHWQMSGTMAIVLAVISAVVAKSAVAMATLLLCLALSTPFILFQWTMRRACYVTERPRQAVVGGVVYTVLILLGAYVLFLTECLSAPTAIGLMGVASLVSGGFILWSQGEVPLISSRKLSFSTVLVDHWKYGRWAVGAAALTWLPGNVYYIILPIVLGLEATGAFRALLTLLQPMLQTLMALSFVVLPTLSRRRGEGVTTLTAKLSVALAVLAALYWLMLGALGPSLIRVAFGVAYERYAPLLWLLGGLPVMSALITTNGSALRAGGRPDLVFRSYALTAPVTLALAVYLTVKLGLVGAVVGLVSSYVVTALLQIAFNRTTVGECTD